MLKHERLSSVGRSQNGDTLLSQDSVNHRDARVPPSVLLLPPGFTGLALISN